MEILTILITIAKSIYLLFLPGFVLSLVIFQQEKISFFERFVFSFVLSITVVPLVVFFGNLFGIPVTTINVLIQTLLLITICIVIIIFKKIKILS